MFSEFCRLVLVKIVIRRITMLVIIGKANRHICSIFRLPKNCHSVHLLLKGFQELTGATYLCIQK